MKIIFLSQDGEIEELVSTQGKSVILCNDEEQVFEKLEKVEEDENCLLFLDFDFDKKACEKFNKSIFKNDWITRIVITSTMSVKELQKHQKGKTSAHGYVKKPLTKAIFNNILEDLNLSQVIEENKIFEEGQSLPSLNGSQKEKVTSSVQGSSELKMNPKVRSLVDLHSVKGERPPYEGELNDKIQAKFDSVFGEGEFPGLKEGSKRNDSDKSNLKEKAGDTLEESSPGISLDLGEEDLDSDGVRETIPDFDEF